MGKACGRAGARPSRREGRRWGNRSLYFLGLDLLEDVALEVARAAEKAKATIPQINPTHKRQHPFKDAATHAPIH